MVMEVAGRDGMTGGHGHVEWQGQGDEDMGRWGDRVA